MRKEKHKNLLTLRTIYSLLVLVAVCLTVITISYLPPIFTPFHLREEREPFKLTNTKHEILFYDYNGDGIDEMVRLKADTTMPYYEYGLINYESQKLVKQHQWHMNKPWITKSLVTTNANNNNLTELYIFACDHDSLFLYTLEDHNDEELPLEPEFIMTRKQKPNNHQWDIRLKVKKEPKDWDGDGHADLLFCINSGYSLEPRGIYVYSPFKHQLVDSTQRFGAYFARLFTEDINDDGEDEIIVGSKAYNNIDYPIPFPDDRAYLMIFNKNLELIGETPEFPGKLARTAPLPFQTNGQWKILTAVIYDGTEAHGPRIELFDSNGNRIWREEVQETNNISIFKVHHQISDNLYYFDYKNRLHQIDEYQNELATFSIKNENYTDPVFYDLNKDNSDEIIFAVPTKVWITDESFKPKAVYFSRQCEEIQGVYLKRMGREKPQLVIRTNKNLLFFSHQPNRLYYLRFPIYLFIFGLIYSFLWGNFNIYRWRLFSKKLIQFSSDDAGRGILRLDTRGRIKYVNTIFFNLIKIDHHVEQNEHFRLAFANIPKLNNFIQNLMIQQDAAVQKIEGKTSSIKMTGNLIGKPIKNTLGITFGYLIELHDFSKPIRDDRIKTWSKTVQKMAHDIKTPLSSVALNLKTLYLKLSDQSPQTAQEYQPEFSMIQGELKRVTEMSKSFMKFVNLDKPNIQAVSLTEVVSRVKDKFHTFFNGSIQFSSEIDKDAAQIWADPHQMEMAMQILIENAIDAVKGKGQILITAQLAQYLDKNFENYVEVNISDTGTGISSEIKNQIFEPYFTTKSEGTGIGLAIVKKIIDDHDGEIEVSSRVNFATTFRIMLPMRNEIEKDI